MATKTKATPRRKAQAPAEDSSSFGPIAERFRRGGDPERAIALCREGLQKFPNQVSARVTLGWALLETGKFDEARVELEQALRKAPDNLAAIRGLAELHDRAEHTLNLPMDGPGHWPPNADEVDEAAGRMTAPALTAVAEAASAAVMSPPELGLAMWSPVPEPEVIVPAAHTAPGSGMSSVRELDPSAMFVTLESTPAQSVEQAESDIQEPELIHSPAAAQPHASPANAATAVHLTEEQGAVSEAEIAALIAEAESLEVGGDAADVAPTLVLDADVDLSDLSAPEPFEVGGGIETVAGPQAAVELAIPEPTIVHFAALAAEPEIAEEPRDEPMVLVAAAAPVPTAEVEEATAALVADEPPAEAALETSTAAAIVAPPTVIEEPVAVVAEPDVVIEEPVAVIEEPIAVVETAAANVEPVAIVEETAAPEEFLVADEVVVAEAPPVAEQPAEMPVAAMTAVELAPEPVAFVEPVIESAVEPVALAVDAPAFPALVPVPVKTSPIGGLERFLAQVRNRRRQVMAESVA